MKHTPGPWHVVQAPKDPNAFDVYPVGNEHHKLHHGAWGKKSDAHLIAAAPDMYEALKAMFDCCQATNEAGRKAEQLARAALAKAEGKK